MNVVPVHAPDTLPFIFERGLVGTYHDWCESFGTYPRSYDLLHADHLFSRLKNRCFLLLTMAFFASNLEDLSCYPINYIFLNTSCYFCRCKQPASIVVEMDRMLRPGGWAIIRDKVEILDPLEGIFKSLHWDIRMTYSQQKEGILCAQKTTWRP